MVAQPAFPKNDPKILKISDGVAFSRNPSGIFLNVPNREQIVECTEEVFLVLSKCKTPTSRESLLGKSASIDAEVLEDLCNALVEVGVLEETDGYQGAVPDKVDDLIVDTLVPLTDLSSSVAGLLRAAPSAASHVDASSRLRHIIAELRLLEADLGDQLWTQAHSQLGKITATLPPGPFKLHVGCGPRPLPGWINVDFDPAPLSFDIRRNLPLPEGSVQFAYMSHVLEHLRYPDEAGSVLDRIRSLLSPGGVLRVVVPDIEKYLRAYVNDDREFFEARRATWTWWDPGWTLLDQTLRYAGASPAPAAKFSNHQFGYDLETLSKLLLASGFADVIPSTYMGSTFEALRVDHSSSVASAAYGGEHYSLFVDAVVSES